MKIRIEIVDELEEEEILIRCKVLSDEIQKIQKVISDTMAQDKRFIFYKGETAYYIPLEEILFFETEGNVIQAHTKKDMYRIKYRLYELEEILPGIFMRVSKSTIMNTKHIYSISKSVTSSCVVEFYDSHKQVYVSRYYYKPLRERMEEKR